jgi:hypothetical protein
MKCDKHEISLVPRDIGNGKTDFICPDCDREEHMREEREHRKLETALDLLQISVQRAKESKMDALVEALKWLVFTFKKEIGPYEAITDLNAEPQRTIYWCHGCDGEFVSIWPEWEEPTDEIFSHSSDCKYMEVIRLIK